MQRKVIISCAVTGSAELAGQESRRPGDAGADREVLHRRRQGRRGHRPHPRARPQDHQAEHGRRALSRGGRAHPGERHRRADQPHHRPGRALRARSRRSPQGRPRHDACAGRTTGCATWSELRPDICSLDMGSLNMGSRVFINTPEHLQNMAVAIRDAGVMPELEVFETGHLLLAKKFIGARPREGAGHVPDLPRHFLGPAGDARGDDVHAQPAAGGFALVRLRHFAAPVPDGGADGAARRPSARRARGQPLSGEGQARAQQRRAGREGRADHRGARRHRRDARRCAGDFGAVNAARN